MLNIYDRSISKNFEDVVMREHDSLQVIFSLITVKFKGASSRLYLFA